MTERWRRALGRLDREDPDQSALRVRAEEGPRVPEPSAPTGSRVVAAVVALLIAVGGTTLAVRAFDSGGKAPATASIDPAAVCGFTPRHGPEYVSLDGHEIPQSVLDEPGTPFSELSASVVGDLRPFITHGGVDAGHPPEDGWRVIDQRPDGATVAAPNGPDWYVIRIDDSQGAPKVGGWAPYAKVLPTAADRGAGLRLVWDGTTEMRQGGRAEPKLFAVNDGANAWRDDRGEYWAVAHVFDPITGHELYPNADYGIEGVGREYDVPPGGRFDMPVANPTGFGSLTPGTYDIVACVAELSLASPIGELRVVGDVSPTPSPSEPSPTILVAKSQEMSMDALAEGTLTVVDGCLALGGSPGVPTFVIWPAGSTLVERDAQTVVIDADDNTVARVGGNVHLGGGFIDLSRAEGVVDGDIPAPCRVTGERYFLAGSAPTTPDQTPGTVDVTSPLGFALTIPDSWSVQDIDGSDGRTTTQGVVVSSVPLPKPTGTQILPDLTALPPGEAVLMVLHVDGGPSPAPGPETPLPLSWDGFQGILDEAGFRATQPLTLGGITYTVMFEPAGYALDPQRDDVRAIVASIRPASG
jgi:hypothetical protein